MIKRALISVSNKEGIIDFAKKLYGKGIEILSTGGTAKFLRSNNIPIIDVSDFTGHPEIMDGRVKTLHPKVHGGLLAIRDNLIHMTEAKEHDIDLIDLVVVNLYPFSETVMQKNVTHEEALEQIDIGGPTLIRSAAKNYKYVTVVTDPDDYNMIWEEIEKNGNTTEETRQNLSEKVFKSTANYDGIIANYLTRGQSEHIMVKKISNLRYGENPHQEAAFYCDEKSVQNASIPKAEIIQGKELSYNNIIDADAALSLVREFEKPTVAFVKHTNPCGVCTGENLNDAFHKAYAGDSKSAFGGIIAFNKKCTANIAKKIIENFFEIIIAPDYEPESYEIFRQKPDMRVLMVGKITPEESGKIYSKIYGGLLIQDADTKMLTKDDLKTVTKKQPTDKEINDLLFAWQIVKHVKSNAIVFAKDGMTIGIGAGQMSRIDSVEIAIKKANGREKGAVMASDAFFPFADSIEAAAKAGITAIIQPGGSKRDQEVIDAADEHGIVMVFTGVRAFLH